MNREHQKREKELIRKYQEKAREIERLREKIEEYENIKNSQIDIENIKKELEEYKKKYNDLQNSKIIPEEKKYNTQKKKIINNKIKKILKKKKKDINKEIKILNNNKYSNKEEIEKNCEIFIENNKIDFTYKYKFNKIGEYNITFNSNKIM